jgi:hypothetical protein
VERHVSKIGTISRRLEQFVRQNVAELRRNGLVEFYRCHLAVYAKSVGSSEGKAFRHRLRLKHGNGEWWGDPYVNDGSTDEVEGALRCLHGLDWATARACFNGLSLEEANEQTEAASLARRMDARMENTMKRSARVTALALNLHEPGLMQELIEDGQT